MKKNSKINQNIDHWYKDFLRFLNINQRTKETVFHVGDIIPCNMPELTFKFMEEQTTREKDSYIPSFDDYKEFFSDTEKEPKPPSRATIEALAEKKYFAWLPDKELWIEWRLKKELQAYSKTLQTFRSERENKERIKRRYSKTREGYFKYLESEFSEVKRFLNNIFPLYLTYKDMFAHSYITGGTGSGKTELIKCLIHALLTEKEPTSAIIILDPHGDFALQVAQFKENANSDRLVYFDPYLEEGKTPTINPLSLKERDIKTVDKVAQIIVDVFQEMIESNLTTQMNAILFPCLCTLLLRGNTTLRDLQNFLKNGRNEELIKEGKNSPITSQREFFETSFHEDAYNPSKHGVYTKLQSLLHSPLFYNAVIGQNTINLEEAINQKKLIIFNLAKGRGAETSRALGKFILARLQAIALERERLPEDQRTPIFLFVDECQNYISRYIEEMLTDSRKYKVAGFFAQQIAGQDMDTQLKNIVLGCTGIKWTGKNALMTHKIISHETGVSLEELQTLKTGTFYVKLKEGYSVPVKVPEHLISMKNAMSAEEWEQVRQKQLNLYYRSCHAEELPNVQELGSVKEIQKKPNQQPERPKPEPKKSQPKAQEQKPEVKLKFDFDF